MKYLILILTLVLAACTKTPAPETVLEEFVKSTEVKNVKTNSFQVVAKSCEEKKCSITYNVSYETKTEKEASFSSEVQKIAQMVLIEDKWLIAEVNNVKTFHESLEPINPLQ